MIVPCFQCGLEHKRKPSEVKEKNFCSRKCHTEHQRQINKRIEIECEGCGKPLSLTHHEYHVKKIRKCSFDCRKNRVITNCEVCGKVMDLKYADYHTKKIRRCSFECRKKQPKACAICGEWMVEYQSKQKYCSIACRGIARRGNSHPLYKRGYWITPEGYVMIRVNGKCISEHRHVMQQHLERNLEPWEHVHHKNKNPQNNDLDNLEVMSRYDHLKLHSDERQRDEKGRYV